MFDDNDIERASKELSTYRNDAALNRILDSYATLLDNFQRLKSDYEEERNSRERYKQIAKRQDRKPFVLVLVDGDGYIFHESLVKQGAEGGRRAAQLLDGSIKLSLHSKGLEHCDIMVRIYANVAGLSKALSKAGLGGHDARSHAPFIASFNRSYGLYDFVDAGDLKENADFKLRATLRHYADIPSCRQIYFAACHDVGYVSELTPHMSDKSRFTLVETTGVKFHEEFKKLNLSIEHFRGVFRTTPLDYAPVLQPSPYNKPATIPSPSPISQEATAPVPSQSQKSNATICTFFLRGYCKRGDDCYFSHGSATDKTSTNWREKTRSKLGNISDLPPRSQIPEQCVVVNAEGHRLDPVLATGSWEATRQLKNRSKRICNEFHLLGTCKNGHSCEYDHSPLGPGMQGGVEALGRSILCTRKGGCRSVSCIKGHVCQQPGCNKRGGKEFCRLPPTAHMLNFAPANYVEGIRMPTDSGRQSSSSLDDEDDTNSHLEGVTVTV